MVPYEAFLAEKPVVTTTDAGGPLDVVHDRETGLVVEPTPARLAAALRDSRSTRRGARLGARRQGARRARHLGHARSTGCSREGRLLLAAAAGALGDRGLQRAAPARARAAARRRRRPARANRRARAADLALYHVGNNPEAHGWIVEALRARPGVVVLHEFVAAPPRRRPDARPRRRPRLPGRDGARGRARRAAARARRHRRARSRRSGRRGPRTSRSPARCSRRRPA